MSKFNYTQVVESSVIVSSAVREALAESRVVSLAAKDDELKLELDRMWRKKMADAWHYDDNIKSVGNGV